MKSKNNLSSFIEKNSIDIDTMMESIKYFKSHLELENNDRILFSGEYGTGKSSFLKVFFDNDVIKNRCNSKHNYNVIHLFPVNYSVTTNEDIFNLLKYDILFSLISKFGVQFNVEDIDYLLSMKKFFGDNIETNVKASLALAFKIGEHQTGIDYQNGFESVAVFLGEIVKHLKSSKSNNDEGELAFNFIDKIQNGSNIYEFDIYTKLLIKLLKRIKTDESYKNILIIDDLDRLDPGHVFRLFNVFASHLDSIETNEKNKFGFDQVIFVCDVNNIKNIYNNLYGVNVDFNGYIDKFFSKEVFHFKNNYSLKGWIEMQFKTLRKINDDKKVLYGMDYGLLESILHKMINNRLLNFREIRSFNIDSFESNYKMYFSSNSSKFYNLHFTKIAFVLIQIFGGKKLFLDKLNKMQGLNEDLKEKQISEPENLNHFYYYYLFPVLKYKEHRFKQHKEIRHTYSATASINMTLNYLNGYYFFESNVSYVRSVIDFWKDLKESFEILIEQDIL